MKDLVFFDECAAVDIPKHESRKFGGLFWVNRLLINNYFYVRKPNQHGFDF
jgi:hypothetical protein